MVFHIRNLQPAPALAKFATSATLAAMLGACASIPAPLQGQDTDTILQELGYGEQRIAELRAAFIV